MTPTAENDAPECVRCRVEEDHREPATMDARHPYAGNTIPVCDRHGGDLVANGWTRVIPPDKG